MSWILFLLRVLASMALRDSHIEILVGLLEELFEVEKSLFSNYRDAEIYARRGGPANI